MAIFRLRAQATDIQLILAAKSQLLGGIFLEEKADWESEMKQTVGAEPRDCDSESEGGCEKRRPHSVSWRTCTFRPKTETITSN